MTESNVSRGLNEVVRNNIVKIIETKDLKVSDLERKSKFSPNTIYKYLNGSRRISLNVLDDFSKILNINSKLLVDRNLIVEKKVEIIIGPKHD
jgi:transcriptional regulator with XRE-family HTH domain|tara:strand:- start:253 stop:531 length:279 start_codon:yes stop_codon:yes gene_type:complete